MPKMTKDIWMDPEDEGKPVEWQTIVAKLKAERDALQQRNEHVTNKCKEMLQDRQDLTAQVARLLEAGAKASEVMHKNIYPKPDVGPEHPWSILTALDKALAETPAQSLSAVRNEVLDQLKTPTEDMVDAAMLATMDVKINGGDRNAFIRGFQEAIRAMKVSDDT